MDSILALGVADGVAEETVDVGDCTSVDMGVGLGTSLAVEELAVDSIGAADAIGAAEDADTAEAGALVCGAPAP
jgi:hypothetical protein